MMMIIMLALLVLILFLLMGREGCKCGYKEELTEAAACTNDCSGCHQCKICENKQNQCNCQG